MIHRLLFLLLLVVLAYSSPPSFEDPYPNFTSSTFLVDDRSVDAYVPDCAHPNSPIILSLHAWATKKDVQKRVDRLPAYAGSECAVIVYPEGKERGAYFGAVGFSWNAGGCCPNADTTRAADVAFLSRVITKTAEVFNANGLVFVVGISNGGMMANRLACTNHKVKAFVAVAGPLMNGTGNETQTFVCSRSVPMLHFHGVDDAIVPYHGCPKDAHSTQACRFMSEMPGFPPLPWAAIPDTIAGWRKRNGIGALALGSITFRNGSTSCRSWGSSSNNVSFCTVAREGHAWPGECSMAGLLPGMKCSYDVDASREAMDFFRRYIPTATTLVV